MQLSSDTAPAARACAAFSAVAGGAPQGVAFAPGRVNLVGEHTDYNDGFVLPMAIAEGIAAAFAKNSDGVVRIHATDIGETREVSLTDLRRRDYTTTGWFRYAAGMAWMMADAGMALTGTTIALASNLPSGAGLSSSAAIELVVARAMAAAAGLAWEPRAVAALGQRAETQFAGVACGIMDQMAVACAHEGAALLLDCRSLETSDVQIPEAVRIVIVNSGVRRSLASSAYNERRAACERAVAAVQGFAPDVRALRDVDFGMLSRARASIDAETFRRASHVVAEIRRPAAFAQALTSGTLQRAGRVMLDSHASLRDLYQVSCAELDTLVSLSMGQSGCYGARLTGAGFGGCIVAMVDRAEAEEFAAAVPPLYEARTGRRATVIISNPGPGVRLVEPD